MTLKSPLIIFCVFVAASSTDCVSIERIFGGEDAVDGQFPFQISLQRKGMHLCGGTIIADRFVLTAAHCVMQADVTPFPPSVITVLAGTNNRLSDGVLANISAVIVHPGYKFYWNDIAVLELEKPLVFSEKIQSIQLAREEVPVGAAVTISGWGRTQNFGEVSVQLKHTTMTVISKTQCARRIGYFLDSVLCLDHAVGSGSCDGDSGGPATYAGKLVGTAAFIVSGCGTGNPDGYSKISYFVDWINSVIF